MKKRMILCLTAILMMVSTLSARMNFWQNGDVRWTLDVEKVDSVTFIKHDKAELAFTFSWQDANHLLITPSDNAIDYIWVATSDVDYAHYQYVSYEEAWQYTVDIANAYGALEEWEMVNHGATMVNLTDGTWNNDHYVLTVAAWDGLMRTSSFSALGFTLSATGATEDAVHPEVLAKDTSMVVMQFWSNNEADNLPLHQFDSITFVEPEPEPEFLLSVTDITNISFRATIVPADEQTYYFVDYVQKDIVDEYQDGAFAQAYLNQLIGSWKKYYPDKDFADVYLYQGTKTLRFDEGVMGDTDYYLVCFAVDMTDKASPKLASSLYKQAFKTEPTPTNPNLTFEVTVNEKHVATITPSDDTSTYYWTTFTRADVAKYGTPEDVWKANAAMYGNLYVSHGQNSVNLPMQFMQPGTVYLAVAGWDGTQTTKIFVLEFEVTGDMLPF